AINAYIPDGYIENSAQRVDAYRKIASIATDEDSRDVLDELIDRYGDPPKAVLGLVHVALLRNKASRMGIKEIKQAGTKMQFYITTLEPRQIAALAEKYKSRVRFVDEAKPYFAITADKKQKSPELMQEVIELLTQYSRQEKSEK
ncbi:MAG: transcription-repair coupling factor, partial [Ruminococcus sp.]|nr:transcription-repair coupling factor [Ruminococcus sp.]